MVIAVRSQDHRQISATGSRPRATGNVAERISGLYWRIARQRRQLENIAACFREQPAMLPLQIEASIDRLCTLRRAAQAARVFLDTLHPQDTQRLRPYGSIAKLAELEYQTSEAIITLAMFAPICQSVSSARVSLHLTLRYLLPGVIGTLDDTSSQLAALMSAERRRSQEGGKHDH